jgi:hypothetical protein
MKDACILSARRTEVGVSGGSLRDCSPGRLGSVFVKDALEWVGAQQGKVEGIAMGDVLPACHDQNVAVA